MSSPNQVGVLLLNLGTPEAPTVSAIRNYLRTFLSDPEVIRLPSLIRTILLNGVILPFRPKRLAALYKKIWTPEGSPLRVNSQRLTESLQRELGESFRVVLGMRYGSPSLEGGVDQLMACHRIVILPLFPQYATATSRSIITAVLRLDKMKGKESIIINDFYDRISYIKCLANLIRKHKEAEPDFILMSYHGVPRQHLNKVYCRSVACRSDASCSDRTVDPIDCYRAQCFKTSRLLAQELQWPRGGR